MASETPWGYEHFELRQPSIMTDFGPQQYSSAYTPFIPYNSILWPLITIQDGRVWEKDEDTGRLELDDYRIPADFYTPLGDSKDDMVGILRHGETVYVSRERTHKQFAEAGMADIEMNENRIYNNTFGIGRGSYYLHYKLTARDNRPVIAADVSYYVNQDNMAHRLNRGRGYWFDYPLPSFEDAVRAAKVKPDQAIHAESYNALLTPEGGGSWNEEWMQRWNLVYPYTVPGLAESGQTGWFESPNAVADLIAHPSTAEAVQDIDRVAWAIVKEAFEYVNEGKRKRIVKGIGLSLGGIVIAGLIGNAMDHIDKDSSAGVDNPNLGTGGTDGGSMNGPDMEAIHELYSVDIDDAVSSARELGQQYVEPHFGTTVSAYDKTLGKSVEVNLKPSSSWVKDDLGRNIWVSSTGSLKVYD